MEQQRQEELFRQKKQRRIEMQQLQEILRYKEDRYQLEQHMQWGLSVKNESEVFIPNLWLQKNIGGCSPLRPRKSRDLLKSKREKRVPFPSKIIKC